MRTLCCFVIAAVAAGSLPAQDDHAHDRAGLGRVTAPVSCAPEAQRRFEHAAAVLHSFWWEEGRRAFGAVLAADSTCAMAHWGLALHAWGNPFAGGPAGRALEDGGRAARQAAVLGAPTAREQGLIAAAGALYRDAATTPSARRLAAYSDTMARVYRDLPDDPEVAIYYALSLVATASPTDTTFARQKQAAAILNPLFARFPDHPGLAHYIIHANDSPQLAALGLAAARRYAEIAPTAPHAQHMPSHIFIRLGLWDETIQSNWRSYEAGIDFARAAGAHAAPHEFHALDYAVYGYLQRGQDAAARATVALAESVATAQSDNTLIGGYNRTAMGARLALERDDWRAAAGFPLRRAADVTLVEMLCRFTRGIGAARSGDLAAARAEVAALDSIERGFGGRDAYWARVTGIKRRAVQAWILLGAGDTTGALTLARAAADSEATTGKHPVTPGELLPARELEADMLLAVGRYPAALAAYRRTLTREPGRARALFGVARAAELAGDHDAAVAGYRDYLRMMEKADGERPQLTHARAAAGGT